MRITGIGPIKALENLIRGERNKILEITKEVAHKAMARMPHRIQTTLRGRTARPVSKQGKKHRKDIRSVSDTYRNRSK